MTKNQKEKREKQKKKRVTEEPDLRKSRKLKLKRTLKKKHRYVVELKYNKTLCVEARSEADAWQQYKEKMGIRYSEHEPKIGFASPDIEVDEETGEILSGGTENVKEPKDEDYDDDDFDAEEEEE